MVDMGTGIAIAGIALAAAPVAIKALNLKGISNNNHKEKVNYITEEHHEKICNLVQQNVSTRLHSIEEKIDILLNREVG